MYRTLLWILPLLVISLGATTLQDSDTAQTPKAESTGGVKRLTPILFCEAIEPELPFWVDKLGFTLALSIPGGDAIGFASLTSGSTEVMLQTYASLQEDEPKLMAAAKGQRAFLYVEVDDLDAVTARLGDTEIYMPRRETFYGSTELGVRTPDGHYVTLAEFSDE